MLESVVPFIPLAVSAAKAMAWFNDRRRTTKGNVRALIEELKENSRLCFLVISDDVPAAIVIAQFSTSVFDRLNADGFDFEALRRTEIAAYTGLERTDLASWCGKSTSLLIENIYDKIKDVRVKHTNAVGIALWKRRVINIHKRLLLLIRHAKDEAA
jgi:hypothetical protein